METTIRVGFQAFLTEGGEEFGAVRDVDLEQRTIVLYVENAGDFTVPLSAVRGVHDSKVMLDEAKLDRDLLEAIAHAHDSEDPGL